MEAGEDLQHELEMTSVSRADSQNQPCSLDRRDTVYTKREKYISVRGVVCNPHGLQLQPYSWTSLTGTNKAI